METVDNNITEDLSDHLSMDSEIEFGQVEHSQPDRGLRPDQDKHFVVAACGAIENNELPIYVDLDVMRDMESHARENTRVELGGVMLGRQMLDDVGKPFVVITDALRAKHYEATKGSFKFTHETWSQITKERNEFRPELEMVGWYHTHPGWGVFLSGMDLFICNNFFNRPLDVALVIDPCAGDRGWFQWSADATTERTSGFFLMTNRHRHQELNYFADRFNDPAAELLDPRFRQDAFSQPDSSGENMVNYIDNRRPLLEVAIVSMFFFQVLAIGLLCWKLLDLDNHGKTSQSDSPGSEIEMYQSAALRNEIYKSVLDQVLLDKTGQEDFAEQLATVKEQNFLLSENVAGQISRLQTAEREKKELAYTLVNQKEDLNSVRQKLEAMESKLIDLQTAKSELESQLDESGVNTIWGLPRSLVYAFSGSILVLLGVLGGTYYQKKSIESKQEYSDHSLQVDEG